MDDPITGDNPQLVRLQKKLETATGGMKSILENRIQEEQVHQNRAEEQTAMMDKIKADNEALKASAMRVWYKDKNEK